VLIYLRQSPQLGDLSVVTIGLGGVLRHGANSGEAGQLQDLLVHRQQKQCADLGRTF
jgi:hypothetical protein